MKPCRQPDGRREEAFALFCAGVVRQSASRWAVQAASQCSSHRLAGSAPACEVVGHGGSGAFFARVLSVVGGRAQRLSKKRNVEVERMAFSGPLV